MDESMIRSSICAIGKQIHNNGFVAANDGNITVKLSGEEYLTTPTGVSKGSLTPDMIVKVNARGEKIEENKCEPSSEIKVHLRVYENRPDVGSVIHTHPPFATIFAILGEPLDYYLLPESVYNLGAIPVVPYAPPSSTELADALIPYLQDYDVFLLESHGLVTVGADITAAYYKTETAEFLSKIVYHLKMLGKGCERELPKAEIEKILAQRVKNGALGKHPGYRKF